MSETKSIPEPTYVYWLERRVKELEAQVEAQPVCACGDSFTADSVCINCVTSERSSFEAQIEALK